MRRLRTPLILMGILAVLAATYLLRPFEDTKRTAQIESLDTAYLPLIESGSFIREIRRDSAEGSFVIEVNERSIREYDHISLSDAFLPLFVSTADYIPLNTVIADVSHPQDYGFDGSEDRTEIIHTEGTTVIYRGSDTLDKSGTYIRLKENGSIYIIPITAADILFCDLDLIRTDTIPPLDIATFNGMAVSSHDSVTYRIAPAAHEDPFSTEFFLYELKSPFRTITGVRDTLLADILEPFVEGIEVTDYIDDPEPLSAYGISARSRKISIERKDDLPIALTIGDESFSCGPESCYYAVVTGTHAPVMAITKSSLTAVYTDPIELIQPNLLLTNIDLVSQIEITAEGESFIIDGKRLTIDGEPMEEGDYRELFMEIISLSISGLYDEPSDHEELMGSISYTHADTPETKRSFTFHSYDDRFASISIDGNGPEFLIELKQLEKTIKTFNLFLN